LAALFGVAIFYLIGEYFGTWVYGDKYANVSDFLWKYALALTPLLVIYMFETNLIAKGKYYFTYWLLFFIPFYLFATLTMIANVDAFIVFTGVYFLIVACLGISSSVFLFRTLFDGSQNY